MWTVGVCTRGSSITAWPFVDGRAKLVVFDSYHLRSHGSCQMALPVVISKLQFEATTPVSTQVVQTTDGEAHYPAAWERSQVVQSGCGGFLKDTF